nr:RpiB/LacA/LacB family sugar-phosphate isomerase [Candidatus Brachybacter algidus]
MESGVADWGILICGSGNGVAITANKHQGIRCALCWKEELRVWPISTMMPISHFRRFIEDEEAYKILSAYYHASFEGGRHATRVDKIKIQ